jgi:spore coat polysaccharide biosynthesis protein SpsF
MTLAIIVQARRGSSRLPAKVLEDIGGKSALHRCLTRCAAIPQASVIVCAVPEGVDNDDVAFEAVKAGAAVVRGPENDVLARYAKAALAVKAGLVMRVTSDCPFVDPQICGRTINHFLDTHADYGCNNLPARWPHGLDCEVFPAGLLYRANEEARLPYEREHVTPWLRTNNDLKRACLLGPGNGLERLRWTLDHAEDLAFARAVYTQLGEPASTISAAELAALCLRRPDLMAGVAHRVDEMRLNQAAQADYLSSPQSMAA